MGGWDGVSGRDCGSLCGLHRRTDEGNHTCGSGGAAARLLRGASGDGGTAQCGADGVGDGASGGFCAQHQRLLHFVANAPWSDEQMLAKVGELVTPLLTRAGPIEAWIIDDTSFPKKGQH